MPKLDEFISAGESLFVLGLSGVFSGTLSVREGDRIFITKKGAPLNGLSESDIVEVGIGDEPAPDASDDLPIHKAIYKETQFNAIIQAYPPNAIALSMSIENKIMPQDSRGQFMLRSIPVVRARTSNLQTRIDELSKYLPPIYKSGYSISVVKDFGTFAVSGSLNEALELTVVAEASCKIITTNKMIAGTEKQRSPEPERRRSAIPPSIGVMDRRPSYKRGLR